MTDTINNKIPFVPENTIDPAAGLNLSLNTIDALLQVIVQSVGENMPPAGVEGQRFVVGESPTGLWAGQANKLARFMDGAWQFFDARYVLNAADRAMWVKSDSGWSAIAGEWSAETVTQSEAEAGTATTRRAWTSLRVRQAVEAWWLTVSTVFGRNLVGSADAAGGRTALNCADKAGDTYTGVHDFTGGNIRFTGTTGFGEIARATTGGGIRLRAIDTSGSNGALIDVDGITPDGTSSVSARYFRSTNTTGPCTFTFHKGNGSSDTQHTIDGKGAARLNRLDGETVIGSATSNNVDKLQVAGSIIATGPIKLASFTLATLPAAAANARGHVYCSNLAGQAAPVFSDGTNWRRVSDNTIAN